MSRGKSQRPLSHGEAEETRRTILRTAQRLFMEYGYRAISTRQLADACGLTQPALYHHFSDKQALYVAMAQEEVVKMKTALERIAQRHESVEDRLKRVVTYLLGTTQHDLNLMFHDIRYELSNENRALLDEAFQTGVVSPIASIFEEGIQQGLLRSPQQHGVDARTSAYLFLSMVSQFLTSRQHELKDQTRQAGHVTREVDRVHLIVHSLLYGLVSRIP